MATLSLLSDDAIAIFVVLFLVLAVGWYGRGFVDFLRGLRTIKNGWGILVEKVNNIQQDVEEIQNTLQEIIGPKFAEAKSPTSLNQRGDIVAKKLNAEAFMEKYISKIQIDEKATAYAIQQECFRFASDDLPNLITKDEMQLIEETAFTEGAKKETIFRVVLGIVLRDKVLNTRSIPISKVDE